MCVPTSPRPPGLLLPGGEEVWGERDQPGDTFPKLMCVISHVSTLQSRVLGGTEKEGSQFRLGSRNPAQLREQSPPPGSPRRG